MTHTVKVNPSGKTVSIINLTVSNPDFFSVLSAQPEGKREQTALDIIAVGSAAMSRVQTTIDVDFVEKRFGALSANFERALAAFEKQATDALTKRLSPTESGSYIKHIADVVGTARKDFQGWTAELTKAAKELLDPEKKGSAVGRLEELVEQAAERFEQMFDPETKGSYAAQLSEQLDRLFGGNGRAGVLQAVLTEATKPVLTELRELKEKVEARKAAEQVIAASTLKGQPFEDEVGHSLMVFARPFGDDVQHVGQGAGGTKAGDFLVDLNGSAKRLVVEARNRNAGGLPTIKAELERQMAERQADFAIYVAHDVQQLPQHVGAFQMYDHKLVTSFDNLEIAYRLARSLLLSEAPKGEVDVATLRSVLGKARDALGSIRTIKGKATQATNLIGEIHDGAEEIKRQVLGFLDEAEALLTGTK